MIYHSKTIRTRGFSKKESLQNLISEFNSLLGLRNGLVSDWQLKQEDDSKQTPPKATGTPQASDTPNIFCPPRKKVQRTRARAAGEVEGRGNINKSLRNQTEVTRKAGNE